MPSAPSLCAASHDEALWRAHIEADYAVMDSGFLAMLLYLTRRKRPARISGHQIIEHMLDHGYREVLPFRTHRLFWVVPSRDARQRISKYLQREGFDAHNLHFHIPPMYESDAQFRDEELAAAIRDFDPQWVVICISGGRQEKLGFELRGMLARPVPILCTGAAIFFFSGGQAHIPRWADRCYLGWLFRILDNPKRFLPRYLGAFELPLALARLARYNKKTGCHETGKT